MMAARPRTPRNCALLGSSPPGVLTASRRNVVPEEERSGDYAVFQRKGRRDQPGCRDWRYQRGLLEPFLFTLTVDFSLIPIAGADVFLTGDGVALETAGGAALGAGFGAGLGAGLAAEPTPGLRPEKTVATRATPAPPATTATALAGNSSAAAAAVVPKAG